MRLIRAVRLGIPKPVPPDVRLRPVERVAHCPSLAEVFDLRLDADGGHRGAPEKRKRDPVGVGVRALDRDPLDSRLRAGALSLTRLPERSRRDALILRMKLK